MNEKKISLDELARHIAALDGCWYSVRQQFLHKYGRPYKNYLNGQQKFQEYLDNYIKSIKEKLKQPELF
ncbi:MAG: hypothetical protein QW041_03300 [Candidatus Pacearchaeota archaeon]